MDILFLPKYGARAASCRYRFLQYLPYLARHGVRAAVSPLFDDAYLDARFQTGQAPPLRVIEAVIRRLRAAVAARRYDLVVLGYEALPYFPALLEAGWRRSGLPYVVDYDDAIFHQYDHSPHALVRRLYGRKIERVIAGSAGVLAGSEYLAAYARRFHPRVAVLPTVVDLARYPAGPPAPAARPFTVGWIGSPSTAAYLPAIAPALGALCAEGPARLVLIGSGPVHLPGVPVSALPWRAEREVADLQELDAGIMPLPDTPWARGKCGFKLIQYMACWLPVVASPVGANLDIVRPGENGLPAGDVGEWLAALRRLRDDADLRRRLGEAGRATVAERYCLQVTAPRLLAFLRGAAGTARTSTSTSTGTEAFTFEERC